MSQPEFADLKNLAKEALARPLQDAFDSEAGRLERLSVDAAGIHFDLSKTHLDADVVEGFLSAARAMDFEGWRARLFAGDVVNPTENRAASHPAERGSGNSALISAANEARERMKAVYDRVASGDFGPVDRIVHIGIGGSFLGPRLLADALPPAGPVADVRFVGNIDGVALERALLGADPARTLAVVVSKSATTLETMTNAESLFDWMRAGGVEPGARTIAVSANPDKTAALGIPDDNVFSFADTVGGRYSLWTGVSLAAVLRTGWDAYEAMLHGAAKMDRHFAEAPLIENAPFMASCYDLLYTVFGSAQSRAIFAYDERLRLLPDFLQQLETESNGKRVTRDGAEVRLDTSPVVWGGVGTDAQHSVFQLMHQGTRQIAAEFVAVAESGHELGGTHHKQLLSNAIAQGAALFAGRTFGQALEETGGDEALAHAKTFPGGRPSMTTVLPRLDPETLGALISFYEHRTFSFGTMLGINSFDQMGVELGKQVATRIAKGDMEGLDPSSRDLLGRLGVD